MIPPHIPNATWAWPAATVAGLLDADPPLIEEARARAPAAEQVGLDQGSWLYTTVPQRPVTGAHTLVTPNGLKLWRRGSSRWRLSGQECKAPEELCSKLGPARHPFRVKCVDGALPSARASGRIGRLSAPTSPWWH